MSIKLRVFIDKGGRVISHHKAEYGTFPKDAVKVISYKEKYAYVSNWPSGACTVLLWKKD